jgi:hypothetical protein
MVRIIPEVVLEALDQGLRLALPDPSLAELPGQPAAGLLRRGTGTGGVEGCEEKGRGHGFAFRRQCLQVGVVENL